MPDVPWWKTAVVYQIYPRSFCDTPFDRWSDGGKVYREHHPASPFVASSGDGIGDLPGIRGKLDHLRWLGVDAIWLSPFFRSPMADFGYDVADYCDVDPVFGSLADFDALVDDAHAAGIRVLIDWVPNHTSDQHPWFVESRSSRDSPKRHWYVWRDGDPDHPPNNWTAAFTRGSAWTWDEATEAWYLHCFLPAQPDLDWSNPEVRAAMHDTLRFWLDRGVDGFRVDVAHLLGKPDGLPDVPADRAHLPVSAMNDDESTHEHLRGIRKVLEEYPGDRAMVGEVFLLSTAIVAKYYGNGDELHMAFNFPPLFAPWEQPAWRRRIERVIEELHPRGAWPTWVLSNHDNPRHRTRYGSEARARAAAVLLLTLRGTPFLFAGEELGLADAVVPPERTVDPGGRDGCRAPIPWTAAADHGWPGEPWLPWPPEIEERNAERLAADPGSILHLYRRLLAVRRATPSLQTGDLSLLDGPEGVLAYERGTGDQRRLVLVNFSDQPRPAPPAARGMAVEVSSDGNGEGTAFGGELGGDQAVVLRP